MNCNYCGARLYKNAVFCAHCGAKVEQTSEQPKQELSKEFLFEENSTTSTPTVENTQPTSTSTEKKFSGKAITGFVLSLAGFFIAGIPCGVLGIIFSSLALGDIKRKNYTGKGLAISGLVVSIVLLVISIFTTIHTITTYIELFSLL